MKAQQSRNILLVLSILLLTLIAGCHRDPALREGKAIPHPSGQAFLVIGDNRSGHRIYKEIIASITTNFPWAGCLINVGDMIAKPGDNTEWERFLRMTSPLSAVMPWYGAVGNHDVNSLASQQVYLERLNLPGNELYYSFDLLESHFIVLDTEIPGQVDGIEGDQLAWFEQDLQHAAPSARHIFVFTHQPPFPQGRYAGDVFNNAEVLHRLCCQYGVDIVFSGHEHQYYAYQKDSVRYVVTGGGGARIYTGGIGKSFYHYLLVELRPEAILIHVLDVDGKEIQTEKIS